VDGFAGGLHGSSYVTDHVDIGAVMLAENMRKLRDALGELNPVHRMTEPRLIFLSFPPRDIPVAALYLATEERIGNVRAE